MPSRVTEVPGSHGPRQSGSVMVPTDVPMQMSTISLPLLSLCLARLAGGDLLSSSPLLPAGTEIVWCIVAEIMPGAICLACDRFDDALLSAPVPPPAAAAPAAPLAPLLPPLPALLLLLLEEAAAAAS